MTKKTVLYGILGICSVLGVLAFFNLTPFRAVVSQFIGSTAGTTNSTSKIASVSLTLSTTTPTTSGGACKLINTDTADRIINSVEIYMSSIGTFGFNVAGVSTLTWNLATSSDIYNASGGKVLLSDTISTSSPYYYDASTTPGATSGIPVNRVWASGTCLNLAQNATSSAAVGIIVVHYDLN